MGATNGGGIGVGMRSTIGVAFGTVTTIGVLSWNAWGIRTVGVGRLVPTVVVVVVGGSVFESVVVEHWRSQRRKGELVNDGVFELKMVGDDEQHLE